MNIDNFYQKLALLNKNINNLKLKNDLIKNEIHFYDELLNKLFYQYYKTISKNYI